VISPYFTDDVKSTESAVDATSDSCKVHQPISAQTLDTLLKLTGEVNSTGSKSEDFSSLMYIAKKLNEENAQPKHLTGVSAVIEELDALDKLTNAKVVHGDIEHPHKAVEMTTCKDMSVEECLGYISIRTCSNTDEDFLSIDNSHSECVEAFQRLHLTITGRNLLVDSNENISLWINLENDEDRELMTTLSSIKLPEIYTLKIENFYESDEDLENFISKSLRTVWNFLFVSESYCVDFHDYAAKILLIPTIKHLYLKGFMIDNEDLEQIVGNSNSQDLTLESWNIAVEDDFSLLPEDSEKNGERRLPILRTMTLIDVEIEEECVSKIIKAIKGSEVQATFKQLIVAGCGVKQAAVDRLFK